MPCAAVLAGAALALRGCPPSSAHPASAIAPASASTIVLVARMPLTPLISRAEHPARPALCQSDNTPRIGPILRRDVAAWEGGGRSIITVILNLFQDPCATSDHKSVV